MSGISPMSFSESLRIGSVDFVSPDEIKVTLDIETPESVSLNAGRPRPFPRINGYVLVPSDDGYLVGQIEWILTEPSQFPKRKGMQDFGLVDLPYPLRKLKVNPLGTLKSEERKREDQQFKFHRGVETFPSVGDPVLIPTDNQLKSIIESGRNRRVKIGTSPLAEGAEIKVDPDRLFGRHLAVLGNTGSGKSCSVAGLIRWSLEAAGPNPNARFIVLDPNGEYARAFVHEARPDSQGNSALRARLFKADSQCANNSLSVPLWLWNSAEWCAFVHAGQGAQRPLLRRALREIRNGNEETNDEDFIVRRKISTILISLRSQTRTGQSYEGWKFGPKLEAFRDECRLVGEEFQSYKSGLEKIAGEIQELLDKYRKCPANDRFPYKDIPATAVDTVDACISVFLETIGGVLFHVGPDEDCPLPFSGDGFLNHIDELARGEQQPQFFDYLVMRIRMLISDARMKPIIDSDTGITLVDWLASYIGNTNGDDGNIAIVDLSLVPSEIVNIITAVIARMVFEALQRYRKYDGDHKVLPTVLVMEEAHTFIHRYKDDADSPDSAAICCQVFEKIAREGRKFGLGLVLSSQRPSELSQTVLSQCNTFLLHRISNDKDQELVQKLVPDNLRGLLRDLPSLPSQNAILLGWASELPVLVRMNDLPEEQQPQSNDPDFWDVWSNKSKRDVDWANIAEIWQGGGNPPATLCQQNQGQCTDTEPPTTLSDSEDDGI